MPYGTIIMVFALPILETEYGDIKSKIKYCLNFFSVPYNI